MIRYRRSLAVILLSICAALIAGCGGGPKSPRPVVRRAGNSGGAVSTKTEKPAAKTDGEKTKTKTAKTDDKTKPAEKPK